MFTMLHMGKSKMYKSKQQEGMSMYSQYVCYLSVFNINIWRWKTNSYYNLQLVK